MAQRLPTGSMKAIVAFAQSGQESVAPAAIILKRSQTPTPTKIAARIRHGRMDHEDSVNRSDILTPLDIPSSECAALLKARTVRDSSIYVLLFDCLLS